MRFDLDDVSVVGECAVEGEANGVGGVRSMGGLIGLLSCRLENEKVLTLEVKLEGQDLISLLCARGDLNPHDREITGT